MVRGAVPIDEDRVRREFGKPFSRERAEKRRAGTRRLFAGIDLAGRTVLDVGAGHGVVAAFLTREAADARIDCLDFAPEFEREAARAIAELGGDLSRIRLVTGDFYAIEAMKADGRLRASYDVVVLHETVHHSTRKAKLLAGFHAVMGPASRMLVVDPVLPPLFRRRACAASAWARELGYVEDPVGKRELLAAFDEAGFDVIAAGADDPRADERPRGLRRLVPGAARALYRERVRPLTRSASMRFVLVSRSPRGNPR
jgi:SAM-dependent methyltransferase